MEILRNRIDAKLVSNETDYFNGHPNQAVCHKKNFMMI